MLTQPAPVHSGRSRDTPLRRTPRLDMNHTVRSPKAHANMSRMNSLRTIWTIDDAQTAAHSGISARRRMRPNRFINMSCCPQT
jgi:hypothetical protein